MSRFGACSARISGDRHTHTHRQTDRQTHRPSTITFAVHAHRGLFIVSWCACDKGLCTHYVYLLLLMSYTASCVPSLTFCWAICCCLLLVTKRVGFVMGDAQEQYSLRITVIHFATALSAHSHACLVSLPLIPSIFHIFNFLLVPLCFFMHNKYASS